MKVVSSPVKSPFNSPSGSVIGLNDIPDISDAVAWYRKGQGITVTGSGVSQWDDQSGENNHLKQATDTNRPSLQSDGSILFDGVDNFLKTDAFTLNQPTTIYVLGKQATWASGDWVFDGNAAASGGLTQLFTSGHLYARAPTTAFANIDLAVDENGIISVVFNAASSLSQINLNAPATGNAGTNNMGGFTLGAAGSNAGFSNIQAQEIIIFNVAHNAEQRAAVIRYLARVGGLTL